MTRDLVIIGGGPAAYTAALYAARASLKPLVIEGVSAGGQLTTTSLVENYPGFPAGVQGPELVKLMREQAAHFGAEYVSEDVVSVDLSANPKKIVVGNSTHEARAVIIATGAKARMLGIPSEQRLWGKGVSTCATCDGFFFKNKHVAVIGGGDSAMEESLFLARVVAKVTVIYRGEKLKASSVMQARAKENPKIEFIWNSVVEEVLGETHVTGLRLKNVIQHTMQDLSCDGMFLAIGHEPTTAFLGGQLPVDELGYLRVQGRTTLTDIKGVFACGDVADHRYRQAITAAGMGCMAALDAERYLGGGKA